MLITEFIKVKVKLYGIYNYQPMQYVPLLSWYTSIIGFTKGNEI